MAKNKVEELTIEEKLQKALIPVDKQPYEIPQNWCWVKINSISNIYTGNSINEKVKAEKYINNPKGLLYIATKDIDFNSYINYETNVRISDYENFKIAPANTSLLCIEGGSAGRKVGFVDQDVCFVNKLCAFTPKKINSKYIYYYLKTNYFSNQFNLKKHGLIGGVPLKDLININFPLPPIAEQERIVNKLDNYISKLNEAKEKLEKVVDTYNYRKNLILHKAFTGELTKKWRKKNKISFNSWTNTNIGNICKDIKVGIVIKPSQYYTDEKNGTPAFRSANVREFHVDNFDWVYLNSIGMELNKRTIVHTGDILIVRSGNPGTACMVTEEFDGFNAIDILIAVPNKDKILSEFLCAYTNSPIIRDEIFVNKRGSVIEHFNVRSYSKLPINLPPIEEQKEIVKILDSILSKEKQVKEIAEQEIKRVEDLKENLLTLAFGGILGTNDPNEETSIELLKSVL